MALISPVEMPDEDKLASFQKAQPSEPTIIDKKTAALTAWSRRSPARTRP